ncbi:MULTISPECIES: AraC family transcriptional regulator [unclassified Bradyrhizobium]|uniref:helix-turn-helix domain-containing protein n=1 Tax=unclassified Bradyrhizobium TaxID=2631580 RepID=UPI001FFA697E|nr:MULTISPECIES: AraC family transcriptional regulator [unclassified Bradyrhizobium]MCK1715348.1 helix-turn-helix transcriptional regulator [Bradyrhizobium sp. 143]MCK1727070.1 helix-turn-helix transcriptional regulator [Bradyrhizobium sp. 142]
MLTDMQTAGAWFSHEACQSETDLPQPTRGFPHERTWREPEQTGIAAEDITISRWTCARPAARREEATTPPDRYFISIALKTTRLKLTRGTQRIFDGIMPAGSLYVGGPSQQLSAQFDAPCDFLHFHIRVGCFPSVQSGTEASTPEGLNDLVLLRDPFAAQLAKALTDQGNSTDQEFAHCIGQTLALHVARREPPRAKINALPKWRLRRVEEYVRTHYGDCISLSDLARVAGLSRMHFAAQFRAATGYRPREYLLHQRVEHAKSLLSNSRMPLAEIALAVGFCTQAHFSTVFKRITGDTPARWRCARRNEPSSIAAFGGNPAPMRTYLSRTAAMGQRESCEMRNFLGS